MLISFKRRDTVRRKIETDYKITEQLTSFNFLGHFISYEKELDIDNILNNYMKITGTTQCVLTIKHFKENKTKIVLSTGPVIRQ
jgi:hypothetical protein